MSHPSTGPEDPDEPAPQPLADEIAASRPQGGRRLDPATYEVGLRRWALLLLIAAPVIWFVVQQFR